MLTLYHFPGAVCAQKVRVVLAEKGLTYEPRDVMRQLRDPEYLKLNPGGYVPTLVHDGKILTESRIINEYLDDAFPTSPLMPEDPYERAQVGLWTKQIDDTLHLNVHTLTFMASMRPRLMAMTPEERERALPFDPTKADRIRDMIANGEQSHFIKIAARRFAKLVEDFDRALGQGAYLVGDRYSLADADYTPYMQRLTDLGLAFLWQDRPRVSQWFARLRTRPSFSAVIADWHSAEEIARVADVAKAREPVMRELLTAA